MTAHINNSPIEHRQALPGLGLEVVTTEDRHWYDVRPAVPVEITPDTLAEYEPDDNAGEDCHAEYRWLARRIG